MWVGIVIGARSDEPRVSPLSSITRRGLGFGVVVGLALTIVWVVIGGGYFWPGWVWFAMALPVALDWSIRRAWRSPIRRSLAIHAAVSAVISAALVVIWLLSGHRSFWPLWPFLGLGVAFAGDAMLVPSPWRNRERALAERVDVLTRTRKTALDVQAAEMRRIERDLHDGAQARLVSIGMSLGMADELVESDPHEVHRLLAEARATVGDALGDLRSLVRGILPPVLADRGLDGAVEALVLASPIPVEKTIELVSERLPAPIEAAAYFAISEAITNVIKHSGAHYAWILVIEANDVLAVEVGDDGHGGADPGQGSGLSGIKRRLEAFDGVTRISSPPGGPTVVSMEVPCERSSPKI